MSVQVKRRREAASFLAGFVGAQGELIVDTTNNRVQVHDGATPGGFAAAKLADVTGRNVAINGSFAVNQRCYVSGTSLGAGVYGHDRWKAGASGAAYAFTQAVPDTSATITTGSLVQVVEASHIYASSFTLSWTGTAKARVWQGTAAGAYAASPLPVAGLTIGLATAIEFQGGTVGLVQFELGSLATPFERRLIGAELALCQRYFQKSYDPATAPGAAPGNGGCTVNANHQGGQAIIDGVFGAPMRVTPTLTIYDGTGTAGKISFYNFSGSGWTGGGAYSALLAHPSHYYIQANLGTNVSGINFDWTASAEL